MPTVYSCTEADKFPQVEFGCQEKVDNKHYIQLFNTDSADDLLFAADVSATELSSTDFMCEATEELCTLMNYYKQLFLEQALENKREWFSRDFDPDMLGDLWKENVKSKTNQIKFSLSACAEEPFVHYGSSGEPTSDQLTKGDKVRILFRLSCLWFSRSNFGATYTVLQMKTLKDEVKRQRHLVREKLI